MLSLNETAELIDIRYERKARLSVPPGAKLDSWEALPDGKLRVHYRYAGVARTNSIVVTL